MNWYEKEGFDKIASMLELPQDNETEKTAGTATKTNPALWERSKAEAKAKMGGKHSARAMQLATQIYKKKGGGYSGAKPTSKNNSLKKWGKQKWQWSKEKKASTNIRELVRRYGVSAPKGRRVYEVKTGKLIPQKEPRFDTSRTKDGQALIQSSKPMPRGRGPHIRPVGKDHILPTALELTLGRQGSRALKYRIKRAHKRFDKTTQKGMDFLRKEFPISGDLDAIRYRDAREATRKRLMPSVVNKLAPKVKGQIRVERAEARKKLLRQYKDRKAKGLSVVTGKPMRKLFEKKAAEGKGVYLPEAKIENLKSSPEGRKKLRAAETKKNKATKAGEQYARHGLAAGTSLKKTASTKKLQKIISQLRKSTVTHKKQADILSKMVKTSGDDNLSKLAMHCAPGTKKKAKKAAKKLIKKASVTKAVMDAFKAEGGALGMSALKKRTKGYDLKDVKAEVARLKAQGKVVKHPHGDLYTPMGRR